MEGEKENYKSLNLWVEFLIFFKGFFCCKVVVDS